MTPRVPGKKEVLLAFLERGVAMVHLDARREGVQVPVQFREDAHLRLNLSYRYRIPDFDVGDEQVRATLSFGGRPFRCVLPWEAIFGITSQTSGDGQVWPEDLPVEVMSPALEQQPEPAPRRPALAPVESDAEPRDAKAAESREPAADGAPRRHLRLVR